MFPVNNVSPLKNLCAFWTPAVRIIDAFDKHWVSFTLNSKEIADVVFQCEDGVELYASKNILASRSVLFKNKYFGHFLCEQSKQDVITVMYPRKVVQYALLWCFTGQSPFCLDPHDLAKLFHFCSYYDLHELTDCLVKISIEYFEKHPEALMFYILHAQLYPELNDRLQSFIVKPNFFL
eukprot:UN30614